MGAATDIATDLQLDTFDMGLDILDSLFDVFGLDDGNALGYARAGVFFGGFAKGGFGPGARRGVGDVPASPLFADPNKFKKAFDKHAKDFGVSGSRNFDNLKLFERNVAGFMSGRRTRHKVIEYHGQGSAVAYFNPATRRIVITRPDGTFWTAYKAGPNQIRDIIERGVLW